MAGLKMGVAVAWTWIFLLALAVALPTFIVLLLGFLLPRRRSARSVGKKIRIAFVHPDLGIGGAERLVVDAAVALQKSGHEVEMFTARHEQHHCFEETRDGTLKVHVFGDFLPRRVCGRFYAACAYLRMCWVSLRILLLSFTGGAFQVLIVDQVSICLPILRLARPRGIIFYCHYPDYLLTTKTSVLKRLYRFPLDLMEELTTGMADQIFVNSSFTAGVFAGAFPLLDCLGIIPSVLYPPLNLEDQDSNASEAADVNLKFLKPAEQLLLSINRFERKKNVGLAIRTLAELPVDLRNQTRLALAGGYDERLPENVEHAAELQALAESLGVSERVVQLRSVSATEKASLLRHAAALLYTPDREHFGIVPVEAMYAQLPVVAVNTGGPLESIVDNETGYLRPQEPKAWADCIGTLLRDAELRRRFGEAGRRRARDHFSLEAFGKILRGAVEQLDADLPTKSE